MYNCGICKKIVEANTQMCRIIKYRETIDVATHLPREEIAKEIPVCQKCEANYVAKDTK